MIGVWTPIPAGTILLVVGCLVALCASIWLLGVVGGGGGSGPAGRVVGIVGRMGSGKSYLAVHCALKALQRGQRVATNFTMKVPRGCRGRWERWEGWEQFATLDNCVVVIDEAHLSAPSHKPLLLPMVARWKLAQARKFRLDVYWISQHEERVNKVLRHLTNIIYVCQNWAGFVFVYRGYEPEKVRRPKQHCDLKVMRFKRSTAESYDTLEILSIDGHLEEVGTESTREIAARYAAKRGAAADGGAERGTSEDRRRVRPGRRG